VRAGLFSPTISAALSPAGRAGLPTQRKGDVSGLDGDASPWNRNGLVFKGAWVWRWKDWIDRRFMRRFSQLPEIPSWVQGREVSECSRW
jgi:hypothetical protein